ncbi:RNA pseudouridine synthase 2, chloroplastic-like, partial [Dendrobium catenatum]|uniref:RNA pseudouridine synthase 2, chloroplastic-like n=1 Tax=Dendrobium catenatum TaxID=906689 RepID=UPI0009F5D1E7
MAAASAVTSSSISTSLRRIPRNSSFRFSKVLLSASPSCGSSPERPPAAVRSNYTGIRLAETVELGFERTRVDSWISSRIPVISRARVQSSIRSGLVTVNGRIIDKVSHILKGGDKVSCVVCELEPLKAE